MEKKKNATHECRKKGLLWTDIKTAGGLWRHIAWRGVCAPIALAGWWRHSDVTIFAGCQLFQMINFQNQKYIQHIYSIFSLVRLQTGEVHSVQILLRQFKSFLFNIWTFAFNFSNILIKLLKLLNQSPFDWYWSL